MKQPIPNYSRPRVGWIKRRARAYMRSAIVTRREAVRLAAGDHRAFCHGNGPRATAYSAMKAWLATQGEQA